MPQGAEEVAQRTLHPTRNGGKTRLTCGNGNFNALVNGVEKHYACDSAYKFILREHEGILRG